eukprot:m.344603 g.344603  ORF g.344603 m.344603 type:complete len:986 (+) comp24757_c0_seq1:449-3406(+)
MAVSMSGDLHVSLRENGQDPVWEGVYAVLDKEAGHLQHWGDLNEWKAKEAARSSLTLSGATVYYEENERADIQGEQQLCFHITPADSDSTYDFAVKSKLKCRLWISRLRTVSGIHFSESSPKDKEMSPVATHEAPPPWYFENMSREESENMLREHLNIDGHFLVRKSQKEANTDIVVLNIRGKTRHFKAVTSTSGRINFDGKGTKCTSLTDLIHYLKETRGPPLNWKTPLTSHVNSVIEEESVRPIEQPSIPIPPLVKVRDPRLPHTYTNTAGEPRRETLFEKPEKKQGLKERKQNSFKLLGFAENEESVIDTGDLGDLDRYNNLQQAGDEAENPVEGAYMRMPQYVNEEIALDINSVGSSMHYEDESDIMKRLEQQKQLEDESDDIYENKPAEVLGGGEDITYENKRHNYANKEIVDNFQSEKKKLHSYENSNVKDDGYERQEKLRGTSGNNEHEDGYALLHPDKSDDIDVNTHLDETPIQIVPQSELGYVSAEVYEDTDGVDLDNLHDIVSVPYSKLKVNGPGELAFEGFEEEPKVEETSSLKPYSQLIETSNNEETLTPKKPYSQLNETPNIEETLSPKKPYSHLVKVDLDASEDYAFEEAVNDNMEPLEDYSNIEEEKNIAHDGDEHMEEYSNIQEDFVNREQDGNGTHDYDEAASGEVERPRRPSSEMFDGFVDMEPNALNDENHVQQDMSELELDTYEEFPDANEEEESQGIIIEKLDNESDIDELAEKKISKAERKAEKRQSQAEAKARRRSSLAEMHAAQRKNRVSKLGQRKWETTTLAACFHCKLFWKSFFCLPCMSCWVRVKAIDGLENYTCCQRQVCEGCTSCFCKCFESNFPRTCLTLEVMCCFVCSINATQQYMKDVRGLKPDKCDGRKLMFDACLRKGMCCCKYAAYCIPPCKLVEKSASLCSSAVFCLIAACWLTQVVVEVNRHPTNEDYDVPRFVPGEDDDIVNEQPQSMDPVMNPAFEMNQEGQYSEE